MPTLETLIRSRRSVLAVVYDDAAYGFEVHRYGRAGADPRTIEFPDTDFAGVAAAFGAQVATVRTVGDLSVLREWCAAGMPGTLVLDCKIVREVVAPFLAEPAGGRGSASEETAGPVTGNHNRQAITGSACPDFERTFNDRDS
ncbi:MULTISPECIES: thiamine pyrophosphate-dependent enzyme [Amycolatopsis]|uniref:thiamine pyrophosphate-dependent enzyme n=1 Tax=Amycolatopsis TaxID=1813 RepID=UPI001E35828C|nr:thiamine pyrophosphate-dependent enzyme [Amycolatopsis bullii]